MSSDHTASRTVRTQQYNDRWGDFGGNANILNFSSHMTVEALRKIDLFKDYSDEFLKEISPDISIAKWQEDSVLFEAGSYIDVAFYIISGKVDVYLNQADGTVPENMPIFDKSHTDQDDITSQTRLGDASGIHETRLRNDDTDAGNVTMLAAMDFNIRGGERVLLTDNDFFGEIGALNGWPQSVTAKTFNECMLCQIRLPALRKMKTESDSLKKHLDTLYRERSLMTQLQGTPFLRHCDKKLIAALATRVELISLAPGKTLTIEDEAVDALYMVRSGFIKLAQKISKGQAVLTYLSKGMTLGEVELLIEGIDKWMFSATAVGYAELVKIEKDEFYKIVGEYPEAEANLWKTAVNRIKDSGYSKRNLDYSELIEFSLEKGLVQGNSILLIDLETCVRCDDCVRGCAETHNNRPRFVREGEKYGQYLIARSCYHCEDPVCLIGCPTGAIRRANVGDVVEINEKICIGCSNCASKCPYDAIIMHDTEENWPSNALPEHLRDQPRKVASKCDLCYSSATGPACVRNCPQGSAVRISSITEFQKLISARD